MRKIFRAALEKSSKNILFDTNPGLSQVKIFFKNPVLSLFYIHGILNSCKISEKSSEQFLMRLWGPKIFSNNSYVLRGSLNRRTTKFEFSYF